MNKLFALIFIALLAVSVDNATADDTVFTEKEAAEFLKLDIEKLRGLAQRNQLPGRDVDGDWRFSKQALIAWLNNSDRSSSHDSTTPVSTSPNESPDPRSKGNPSDDVEAVLLRDRAALNPAGDISAELDLSYSKQATNFMLPEAPDLARSEQKTLSSAVTLRYGLPNGFQVRATAPYQHSVDQVSVNSYRLYNNEKSRFGPARIGMQKLLFSEGSGYPGMIVGISGLLGTTYGISAEASVSKILDPAILFASFQYIHQFATGSALQPETQINGQLGFGLKMNDDLAAQIALLARYTGETNTELGPTPGRDDFGVNFSVNWRVAKTVFLQPFFENSLTADGNDMSIGASVIYSP